MHRLTPSWRQELARLNDDNHFTSDPDKDFYLSITSGSTGMPKAIATTRGQWQARYRTARKLFPSLLCDAQPPHFLLLGGMAFSAFFFFLTNHLFVGGTVVLMDGEHHPDWLAAMINEWEDAATPGSPHRWRANFWCGRRKRA